MSKPIINYIVFDFVNFATAKDAVRKIVGFTLLREGRAYLQDDSSKRVVMLAGLPTTLYLSPGALEIARTLWIDLPASKVVHASELPHGLTLLLGEAGDLPKK